MDTELRKLFDFGAASAEHLFKAQGHLLPMWVGVTKRGGHLPLIIRDMDDKDKVAEAIKTWLKKHGISRYVSMLECWTYEGKEIPAEITEGRSLEENPDRREAIHLMAEDKDGNYISGVFYILRPEHGRPTLSPIKIDARRGDVSGRFTNMFRQDSGA